MIKLWMRIRSSLWFIPALFVLGAVVLAILVVELDRQLGSGPSERWPLLFGAGAEGSRQMLSAIAASIITVAGVVFSITIVSFSLAASQYTPRLLRNFMRDVSNQSVFGIFVATFVYSLLVLRTIQNDRFVPGIAVAVAMLLAIVSIALLVYFIHHIASSLQASANIAAIAEECIQCVERQFRDGLEGQRDERADATPPVDAARRTRVPAWCTGYIQTVDVDGLLRLADQHDVTFSMDRCIGDFVMKGEPLLWASRLGQEKPTPPLDLTDPVNRLISIDDYRTIQQDTTFGIIQIVDMAVKALSPGINDIRTAMVCIDYLSAILSEVVQHRMDHQELYREGTLRLVLAVPTFASVVALAFDHIRRSGASNAAVVVSLLQAIERAAQHTDRSSYREVLQRHAKLLFSDADRHLANAYDRGLVTAQLDRTMAALGDVPSRMTVECRHPA